MSWYVQPTEDFSGNKLLKTGGTSYDVKYRLVSTEHIDMGTAWGYAWNTLITQYGTFHGARLKTVNVEGNQITYGQVFEVTGHYEIEAEENEETTATITFSTRGGREKKIHSYGTQSYIADQSPLPGAPNFHHGIGYMDGVFQGVDVVVPRFSFSLDIDLQETYFPNSMFLFFHNLTGTTNAENFWIFGSKEVLFTGLNGNSYRKMVDGESVLFYRLSFEFEVMPSLVNASVPPFSGINKKGQQYFWTFHADKKDTDSQATIPYPVAAYVEDVYPTGDFTWFSTLRW